MSNRVLSCATCNEKEKLDAPWEEFLSKEISDKNLLNKRKKKILKWQRENGAFASRVDVKILATIDSLGNKVIDCYDQSVLEIRKLRDDSNPQ